MSGHTKNKNFIQRTIYLDHTTNEVTEWQTREWNVRMVDGRDNWTPSEVLREAVKVGLQVMK